MLLIIAYFLVRETADIVYASVSTQLHLISNNLVLQSIESLLLGHMKTVHEVWKDGAGTDGIMLIWMMASCWKNGVWKKGLMLGYMEIWMIHKV